MPRYEITIVRNIPQHTTFQVYGADSREDAERAALQRARRHPHLYKWRTDAPTTPEARPMDPNANIQEQERILTTGEPARADRARLATLRAALREWIANGGFAPEWRTAPRASRYYRIPASRLRASGTSPAARRTRDAQTGIPVGSRYRHPDAEE